MTIYDIFDLFLSAQNVNVARFARTVNETFSLIFKHSECVSKYAGHEKNNAMVVNFPAFAGGTTRKDSQCDFVRYCDLTSFSKRSENFFVK